MRNPLWGRVERKTFGMNLDEILLELQVCANVALFETPSSGAWLRESNGIKFGLLKAKWLQI